MKQNLARTALSVAMSTTLAATGATALLGVQALAPSETGLVQQAQAKKASKTTWYFTNALKVKKVTKTKVVVKGKIEKNYKLGKSGKMLAAKTRTFKLAKTIKFKGSDWGDPWWARSRKEIKDILKSMKDAGRKYNAAYFIALGCRNGKVKYVALGG